MTADRGAGAADGFSLEVCTPTGLAEWDRLATEMGCSPFQRPGWVCAWVESFAAPDGLRLATVRRGGELVAVLPLRRRGRWLTSPVNLESPRFDAVARDAGAAQELAVGLVGLRHRPVELTFLPEDGVLMSELPGVLAGSARIATSEPVRCQVYLDTTGRWDDYQSRTFSSQQRQESRRKARRLAELGELTLDVRDGREDLTDLLAEGFGIEARGWKGRAGTAVLSRPASWRFYSAVGRWAAESGILRLTFLRLSGRPIAFTFCLEENGVHYGLKIAHDEEFAKFSPGTMMVLRLLERSFTDPALTRFEMCGGDNEYKRHFSSVTAAQLQVRMLRAGWVGEVDRGAAQARVLARQALRDHLPDAVRPWLVRAAARVGVR